MSAEPSPYEDYAVGSERFSRPAVAYSHCPLLQDIVGSVKNSLRHVWHAGRDSGLGSEESESPVTFLQAAGTNQRSRTSDMKPPSGVPGLRLELEEKTDLRAPGGTLVIFNPFTFWEQRLGQVTASRVWGK